MTFVTKGFAKGQTNSAIDLKLATASSAQKRWSLKRFNCQSTLNAPHRPRIKNPLSRDKIHMPIALSRFSETERNDMMPQGHSYEDGVGTEKQA
jgi:hypothetical protein